MFKLSESHSTVCNNQLNLKQEKPFKTLAARSPFFAIISPARCRSSYLRSLLHSHPEVVCHSELFHQKSPIISLKELPASDLLFDMKWRDQHPHLYIERLLQETQRYRPKAQWMGCKLLLYAHQINRGLDALLDFKPLVILIGRANKLAWYSSLKISLETGIWFLREKQSAHQPTITFNADEFHDMLEMANLCEKLAIRELESRQVSFINIDSESLRQPETISTILDFLNLPSAPLISEIVEQNTNHILNRFTNPGEVIHFAASIDKVDWINTDGI